MVSLDALWNELKATYQKGLSPASYNTWIETANPRTPDQNQLTIEVPNGIHKGYQEKNLATKVVEVGYMLSENEIIPRFITGEEVEQEEIIGEKNPKAVTPSPLEKAMLSPKYTFDTFVIDKGNQMAHAAAFVVVEDSSFIYNPLFFYEGVGLGKTHLMHATGHQTLRSQPGAKVKYVSSGTSANDFINSIQNKTAEEFRQECRNVNLLLVGDVRFFVEKETTRGEFFHTFNTLYDEGEQIVLTSGRLPSEIPELQERLVSRFAWGPFVNITPPDLGTRTAILRKRAAAEHLEIPDDTLSYIAGQIDSNIRELEGTLVRAQAFAAVNSEDTSTNLAADALKTSKSGKGYPQLLILQVQEEVAGYHHVQSKDLRGKKRVKSIVVPRRIVMYLTRELIDNSLPKIGAEFGGKDHTTVIYAHEKVQQLTDSSVSMQNEASEVKSFLLN